MAQAIETEIKFVATPAMLDQLRAHPLLAGADVTGTVVTTYYDTLGARLRRGGGALRIRETRDGRQQTFKLSLPGQSVRRSEWNAAIDGDEPEIAAFAGQPRKALERLLVGAPLTSLATSRIERTTRLVQFGGSVIEVAFDCGTIESGLRKQDVCELELELVDGQFADVITLALHLPIGPELAWSVCSKAERCYQLAHDIQPVANSAHAVSLRPKMNAASGFRTIAWNCLGQLLANYPLVIASADAEAVHQCRVAIRRLRAAFSLFKGLVDDQEAAPLRAELRAAAKALGPARELQVLLDQIGQDATGQEQDISELQAHIANLRDRATQSAGHLLAGIPFQLMLFQLAGWIEGGKWCTRKGVSVGNEPIEAFARKVLSKRLRKLRKLAKPLSDMSDRERHELRIDVKKLRYAVQFFASLHRGRDINRRRSVFLKALGRSQDSLGELNDMMVANLRRNALFEGIETITAARMAAQLAEVLAMQEKSRRKLLRAAERSLTELARTSAWWKAD